MLSSLILRLKHLAVLLPLFALATSTDAQASPWQLVTGAEELRSFMSGTKAERELPSGEISRGEYYPDGAGILHAWGASIPRTWSVKDDDKVCITAERDIQCYEFEVNGHIYFIQHDKVIIAAKQGGTGSR